MVLDGGDVGMAEESSASGAETPKVTYENGKVWLLFPSGAPDGTEIKVYDVRGALVREQRPLPGAREVFLEFPLTGIYFIRAKAGSRSFSEKVLWK